ncbi:MAG TPA: hypothetical protein VFK11_02795 [Candidatus Saccharimonadales bacterium]|nr:hypothetical protein [Candidatus Saccharimonadales bacterium]
MEHLQGYELLWANLRTNEAGVLEINGRPSGDYTLPGRADVADSAQHPSRKADLFAVVSSTKKVISTLPLTEAGLYKEAVDQKFFN